MTPIYLDEQRLTQATDACVASGLRTLATHFFGDDDVEHARAILDWMIPPKGAFILDAGCGVGEVALNMSLLRPDLRFTLLNYSGHQLDLCPHTPTLQPAWGDFHATPFADGTFDVVMFNTAICHADVPRVLVEAARVLRPGGQVFISDLERISGDNTMLETHLCARAFPSEQMEAWAKDAGLRLVLLAHPGGNNAHMTSMLGADYDVLFGGTRSVVYGFRKR